MINLSGYTITEEVFVDGKIAIHRAFCQADKKPVIIKTLRAEYPSPEELAKLKHEFEITKGLNLKGCVKTLGLETFNHGIALIFEDVGGDSLKNIITQHKLDLSTFLIIAIQIANAIGELHQNHIIHRDLKPSNLIYNLKTKEIKLTDFSISTRFAPASAATESAINHKLEGTPAYLSPEQSGRINRPVDYRTDFYSLGITFYEILVGWLPFQSNDVMELVHAHLAKMPVAPYLLNPDIPRPLSDIIMKLLAKNPDERYQSAYGLKTDLQQCLDEWTNMGKINTFPIAQHDHPESFELSRTLYGRTEEMAVLQQAFNHAAQAHTVIVFLTGDEGMGKTSLVTTLKKAVMAKQGFFIQGRFENQSTTLPYSAFVQALRKLMVQVLMDSQIPLTVWQQRILEALGENATALSSIIPELETVLAKTRPTTPTTNPQPDNTFQAFQISLQKLLHLFAQPEHPLVLFLDDMQWADNASLTLLHSFIAQSSYQAVLFIGSYRNHPALSVTHPLRRAIESLHEATPHIDQITLLPLKLEHITEWIADSLHCPLSHAKSLAELVMNKTEGNPYFAGEFLKSLHRQQLLYFDAPQKQWLWDIPKILQLDTTDNVISLANRRLRNLAESTQTLLKLAACIGTQFEISTLATLYEHSEAETLDALWEAIEENLILPQGNAYQALYTTEDNDAFTTELDFTKGSYRFVHETVQQVAYSLLPPEQKQQVHYQLGLRLRENTKPGQLEENLFDIVNHLNQGRKLLNSAAENYDLARLNLAAGKKARNANAWESAFQHFQIGLSLLPPDSWERQYHLTLSLHLQALEAVYFTGQDVIADQLFARILASANSLLDQVKAYELKIQFYVKRNQLQAALDLGLQVLHMLNLPLPERPTDLMSLFDNLNKRMGGRQIEQLVDLPALKDAHKLAALRILVNIALPVYFINPPLYPLIGYRQVEICMHYGNSPLAATAYATYSLILCGTLNNLEAGYRFGQVALKVLEKFPNRDYEPDVLMLVNTFSRHWKEPLKACLTALEKARQHCLDSGHIEHASHISLYYAIYAFLAGRSLNNIQEHFVYARDLRIRYKRDDTLYITHLNQVWHQFILNLQGDAAECWQLSGDSCDEHVILPLLHAYNNATGLFSLYFAKALLAYWFKQPKAALQYADIAEQQTISISATLLYPSHTFYYSLILLANYPNAVEREQSAYLKQIHKNQARLQNWMRFAPTNFQHQYDLVNAELARIQGDSHAAMAGYEQAIQGAKQQRYLHEEALANELAGEFYQVLGIKTAARVYLREAHFAWSSWGATAKIQQLEQQYTFLVPLERYAAEENINQQTQTATLHLHQQGGMQLDWKTILKATQALTSEVLLDNLIQRLLHIVVENVGAQRGILLLNQQGQLSIEAEVKAKFSSIEEQSTEQVTRQSLVLDHTLEQQVGIPVTLVQYVQRSLEVVVLDNAVQEGLFVNNPYIMQNRIKSVLCAPLQNKGQLVGVLYLENNLISNAFTIDRLNILTLLSTQIAIAIENALFYQKLIQANQAAEAANRAKSAFLMNMSHELRTPLNAILGYTVLIQEEAEDRNYTPILDDLQKIQTAGKQLLDIISHILDLSKIEANQMGLTLTVFDIAGMVHDVATTIEPSIGNNQLTVNCPPQIGTMRADKIKVMQILLNLLNNAVKFTQQGHVTLSVQRLAGQQERAVDWLQFEVTDTGIGMSAEQVKHIFEAFYQGDTSTTRQYGGTGLGLTLSDYFCRLMDGSIQVRSELGRGSTFTVRLPAQVSAKRSES